MHVPRSEHVQPVAFGGNGASMSAEKKVAKSAERPAKKLGVSGDAKWGRSGWEPAEAPYERLVVAMANRAARKDDITFWIEPDASKPSTSAPIGKPSCGEVVCRRAAPRHRSCRVHCMQRDDCQKSTYNATSGPTNLRPDAP